MLTQQLILTTVIWLLFSGGITSGGQTKPSANSITDRSTVPQTNQTPEELKILAEGFHSSITNPFVAVIRDEETYLALNNLDANLPKLETEFFKSNILIAAFLGQRNTGGYSVKIVGRTDGAISVKEVKPGKGMMLPQMITSPFKMVSFPVRPSSPVPLVLDAAWNSSVRNYSVTKGKFTMTGGIAGRSEDFRLVGHVALQREQGLISLSFILRNSAQNNKIMLADFTTGTVQDSRGITFSILSAGSLVSPPNNGLRGMGKLTNGDGKLSIDFVSLPTRIVDAFNGSGSIEAVRVVPTAKQ